MVCGDPQPSGTILGDALHRIARQTVGGGVDPEAIVTATTHGAVEPIAVAADPQRAVAPLTKRLYLLQNAALGVVELVGVVAVPGEHQAAARGEVDLYHALLTADEELVVACDDAADAAVDHAVAGEGIGEHATAEVIEKDSDIAADPQPLVALIDGESTGEVEHALHGPLQRQRPDGRRMAQVERADSPTPCANPQRVADMVGGECRHAVVGQRGVGGGVVGEDIGAGCLAVEPTLDGAYPQRAVGLGIHRVDTVGRDGAGVDRGMDVVDQTEQTRRQLVDAA